MKLLTKALRKRIPALYAQEELGENAVVKAKFFTPDAGWTWYVTEAEARFIDGSVPNAPLSQIAEIPKQKNQFCKLNEDGEPDYAVRVQDIIFLGLVDGLNAICTSVR